MSKYVFIKVLKEVEKLSNKDLASLYLSCKQKMKEIEAEEIPKAKGESVRELLQQILTKYLCKESK